jgi:predicted phosphohydrolase
VKLAVTADLHLPITPAEKIAALAREVAAAGPDAVAVAGDVGESLTEFRRCLELLRGVITCPLLVLPGNHDLWSRDAPSQRKLEYELPHIVRECGCTWLEGDAFVVDGVAIAGSIAWYDYSAVDPSIVTEPEMFARKKRFYNVDAIYIDWPWTDGAFAELVAAPLLTTLDRLEADPAIRKTVVVTHVPIVECQMCRDSGNPDWAFSNAYFGNLTLGEKVVARKKVTHIISGHTHVGRQGMAPAADGRDVHAQVIASDYGEPAWDWVEC